RQAEAPQTTEAPQATEATVTEAAEGGRAGTGGHFLVYAADDARRPHRGLPRPRLRPTHARGEHHPQHLRLGVTRRETPQVDADGPERIRRRRGCARRGLPLW